MRPGTMGATRIGPNPTCIQGSTRSEVNFGMGLLGFRSPKFETLLGIWIRSVVPKLDPSAQFFNYIRNCGSKSRSAWTRIVIPRGENLIWGALVIKWEQNSHRSWLLFIVFPQKSTRPSYPRIQKELLMPISVHGSTSCFPYIVQTFGNTKEFEGYPQWPDPSIRW